MTRLKQQISKIIVKLFKMNTEEIPNLHSLIIFYLRQKNGCHNDVDNKKVTKKKNLNEKKLY